MKTIKLKYNLSKSEYAKLKKMAKENDTKSVKGLLYAIIDSWAKA